MRTPNIFDYATKELSQDAFICWLVACVREADGALMQCGKDFIGTLMNHGREPDARPCEVTEVIDLKTQYMKVDVYFRARVDGHLISFGVENKTETTMHSNQLERYKMSI